MQRIIRTILILLSLSAVGLCFGMDQNQKVYQIVLQPEPKSARERMNDPSSLQSLCIQKMAETIGGQQEDIIQFIESTCSDMPDDKIAFIIAKYLDYKIRHTTPNEYNAERMRLAIYCASRSLAMNPQADVVTHLATETGQGNSGRPFAMQAVNIMHDLINDPFYTDRAEIQPLTRLFTDLYKARSEQNADTQSAYTRSVEAVNHYLIGCLSQDDLVRSVCQLIARNEESAIALINFLGNRLKLSDVNNYFFIWQWADVFSRERVLRELQDTFQKLFSHGWATRSFFFLDQFNAWAFQEALTAPFLINGLLLPPDIVRKLFKGDYTTVKSACENISANGFLRSHVYFAHEYLMRDVDFRVREDWKSMNIVVLFSCLGYTRCLELLDLEKLDEEAAKDILDRALQAACDFGHIRILDILIQKINERTGDAEEYLQELKIAKAAKKGYMGIIRVLYDKVSDFRYLDALQAALLYEQKDSVQFLLEKSNRLSSFGSEDSLLFGVDYSSVHSLLLHLITRRKSAMLELLLKHKSGALCVEVEKNLVEFPKFIKGSVARESWHSPLLIAVTVKNPDIKMVELLLQHGAQDVPDAKGRTALAFAQQNGLTDIEELLVSYEQARKKRLLDEGLLPGEGGHEAKRRKFDE